MELDFDRQIFDLFSNQKIDKPDIKSIFTEIRNNNELDNDHRINKKYRNKTKFVTTNSPHVLHHEESYLKHESQKLEFSTPSTLIFKSNATVNFIFAIGVTVGLLVLAVGLVFHRKKRTRQLKSREEFSILPKRKNSNPIDPAFYNYVCPQQPIDFVVPLPPALNPTHALLNSPDHSDSAGQNWTDLDSGPASALLGGLNPELYTSALQSGPEEFDFPEGHRGRLWFSMTYSVELERLSVHLIKIKNLPSRVYGSPNCCHPFIRVHLMPDERRYLQSKVRKKNCNPFFDETFVFQLPSRSITERLVKVSVYDNDRGKHHNVIGHAMLPLTDLNTTSTPIIQWKDLEKEEEIQVPCDLGEMMVSLCYSRNLERLIVTVCEARKLQSPAGCQTLDTFVKLIFMKNNKIAKTKKTMIIRNSTDPKYNESFHFKMTQNSINSCNILLQVTQAGIKPKDRSLGRIILGSYMFSRGKSLDHWNEAIAAGHKQIRYWHKLTS